MPGRVGSISGRSTDRAWARIRTGSASVSFASASDIDLAVLDEMVRHAGRLMDWT